MNICVVGDAMSDIYVDVAVDRISPEGPIPVMRELRRTMIPGGAANCARNIESLGGHVYLVALGCNGQDPWPNGSWISESERELTTKTRFVAGGQQIARLDVEDTRPLATSDEATLITEIAEALVADCDCLVISDYGKGVCNQVVCESAIRAARQLEIPIIVDPKARSWHRYRGASLITPNEHEFATRVDDYEESFVLVTRGARGMTLFAPNRAIVQGDSRKLDFDAVPREVASVIGAGDTVTAAMAVGIAAELTMVQAARFANVAAAVAVSKAGTAIVTLDEVRKLAEACGRDIEEELEMIRACG